MLFYVLWPNLNFSTGYELLKLSGGGQRSGYEAYLR